MTFISLNSMFGSNPFGKSATPVQPTAGTTGGLFGSPSAAGGSTGSTGLFGSAARPGGLLSSPAGSTFGMMQPNVGLQQQTSVVGGSTGVTFGGAVTAGGTGTGGLFGASGSFGATGGLGMSSAVGATGVGASVVGGARPAFNPPISTESSTQAKGGAQQTINTKHMVITAMKEYQAGSLEELRMEDYAAGRRGPTNVVGATGGVGMFGSSSVQPAAVVAPAGGGLFGSGAGTGGLFGSSAAASNAGVAKPFGTATSAVPTFGSVASSTTTQNVGGGLFGFNTGAAAGSTVGAGSTGAGGLFGSSTATGAAKPTGFVFGAAASQPASVAAPVTGTSSLFGGAAATGGGLFGASAANAAKPSPFAFGASTGVSAASATPAAGSAFGFGATTGATGGGLFGASAANAAKPFAFGASTGAATGAATATGGVATSFFGAPAAAPTVSTASGSVTGGGLFGGGNVSAFGSTAAKPLFGATQPSTGLTQLGFGSVGGVTGATAAPASVGGAFGFNLQNTGQAGGGLLLGQTPFQSSLQSTVGQPGASLMQQPFQLNQPSMLGNTAGAAAAAAPMSIGLSANHDEALLQQARVQQQVLDLVQTLPYGTAHLTRQLSSNTSSPASLNPAGSFGPYSPVSAYNYYGLQTTGHQQKQQQQQQQQQYMLPVAAQRALANATNFTPNFGMSPKPVGKSSPLARPVQVANRKQLFEGFEQSDSMQGHQHQHSVNSSSGGADNNGLFFLEKSNWKKLTLPSSVLRSSLDSASASAIAASVTAKATAAAAAKSKSLNDSSGVDKTPIGSAAPAVASAVETRQQLPDSSSAI